jgi:hypothetical protein
LLDRGLLFDDESVLSSLRVRSGFTGRVFEGLFDVGGEGSITRIALGAGETLATGKPEKLYPTNLNLCLYYSTAVCPGSVVMFCLQPGCACPGVRHPDTCCQTSFHFPVLLRAGYYLAEGCYSMINQRGVRADVRGS